MSEIPGTGIRLLSFDGGGFRGLSSLYFLREIMLRIRRDEKRDDIEPWQCFDMIVGTSMGGLIALMLGRLRMPINVAIAQYIKLTEKVLSETKYSWQDGIFKATLLEEATKSIVQKYSESRDTETHLLDTRPDGCKVFVCAMSAANMRASIPTHFRTFTAYEHVTPNCKIWEAVRATSADPKFFKRIKIQDTGVQVEYIDGGIGCNNPTDRVLKEADRIFRGAHIACLISIGTGRGDVLKIPEPGLKENTIPLGTLNVLEQIAMDCEATHNQMGLRFERFKRPDPDPGVYFRFNLDQVPEDAKQWEQLGDIGQHTDAYLRLSHISQQVDAAAKAIRRREPRVLLSDAAQ
ncbi:patatin-like phospholipase [Rhizoctonia solani AG-3 Rhs1AP]|uniref:Patatin-like phospholipase n=2 Tax=Rhizoctonia solani AG-3 TaxID=1086053 RepID=A0A074SER2_9AGAM|nr:patatin-like phospholipase [Rhizoctonia solani AG-3 Rhs1AP]KEP55288.1 patatin-like phospholipase [Rhizoctonia solani 123E]